MRDKTHAEQIARWANLIKDKPQTEWRPQLNEFIDAQFDMAKRFRENLKKTQKGLRALDRLRESRIKGIAL